MNDRNITAEWVDDKYQWSQRTFGPGTRLRGVINHIKEELEEVAEKPNDLTEWADIIILALDGASRQGFTGQQIIDAVRFKQSLNVARDWPDWRNFSQDEAIGHIDG